MARPRLVTPDPHGPAAPARAEIVVVGGGITGLSAAWALTRRGREVVVLDQAPVGHLGGGSHGSCRIFRRGYEDAWYVTLAGRARRPWAELEDACGERLLHPTPQLTFGPQMPQVLAAMTAVGAACELLPEAEAAARYPGRRRDRRDAGRARVRRDRGRPCPRQPCGSGWPGRRPSGPACASPHWLTTAAPCGCSTNAGDVEAGVVIVCAGPWTSRLLATAGIAVPASATLEQVAYLEPAAARHGTPADELPIFVHYDAVFPYGLPIPGSRRYKIGIHHSGPRVDPDHQDQSADEGLSERIEQAAKKYLPGLEPRPVMQERCIYDNTPDTDFIVDRSGNVVVGSGTSGHGFKFGPLLGEWLADLALGVTSPQIPGRFALSRF